MRNKMRIVWELTCDFKWFLIAAVVALVGGGLLGWLVSTLGEWILISLMAIIGYGIFFAVRLLQTEGTRDLGWFGLIFFGWETCATLVLSLGGLWLGCAIATWCGTDFRTTLTVSGLWPPAVVVLLFVDSVVRDRLSSQK